jgi:AGZA family xanthine/uracil permease-like MFS transporter
MDDSNFTFNRKRTSAKVEILAGATTFLTMAYIIFVNPSILSLQGVDVTGIERMDKQALIAVTCIVSAIATIIVGIFGKAPIAMAPGMGLNAFFAYTLLLQDRIRWQTALGVVFLSGLFFLILTLLGLRRKLVEAIPPSLISAISVGIGLFITFIGLQNLGIIVQGSEATLVQAGELKGTVLIGLAGLIVMVFLEAKRVKGSLLIGILFSTGLAAAFGYIQKPEHWISTDINIKAVAFQIDILGALKWSLFGSIFTLMFIDLFDSIGTLVACSYKAEMLDENNNIRGLDRLLSIDALATMIGSVFGTSTTTSYIESAAGIEQGGRTGLTSIVTGLLFFLALLFIPVVGVVPQYATAPALIMVGLFMIKEVQNIDFYNLEQAFPAFIIMVMIALSYSISTGLAFGFLSFTIIKLVLLKPGDIKPAMWIIAILSVLFLTMDRISALVEYLKSLT